jgi:DeoR/GlpR family transcriptional regulator of sugar metabolism
MIEGRGHVAVRELAEDFGVSDATVRRDLRRLAEDRRVELVHGGATVFRVGEASFQARATRNIEAKRVIGRLAGELVRDGDMLFVDAGTTCFEMRHALLKRQAVTVIANSTRLATELGANPNLSLVQLGGHYRPERMDSIGPLAANSIDQLRGYVAFLGADGLSQEFGVSANEIQTAYLYQHVIRNARETVLLADHTKFHAPSLYRICDWDLVSQVVTDCKPDASWIEFLRSRQIELVYPIESE